MNSVEGPFPSMQERPKGGEGAESGHGAEEEEDSSGDEWFLGSSTPETKGLGPRAIGTGQSLGHVRAAGSVDQPPLSLTLDPES